MNNKIVILNKAANDIRLALKEIEKIYQGNIDFNTLIWRVKKANDALQSWICHQIECDVINDEFNKIIKGNENGL